jgi:hypothetical protein
MATEPIEIKQQPTETKPKGLLSIIKSILGFTPKPMNKGVTNREYETWKQK